MIRKDKTIEQRAMGKFNSHFYQGVKDMLTETPHSAQKLRIFRGKLFIEMGDDIMPLLQFEETTDDSKYKVSAKHANFLKLGIETAAVDAMVSAAAAAAKSA